MWYSSGAPAIEPKKSKSIIHPFNVKGYSGLTINPYQGCQHRCAYCYATYEWSPEFYDRVYAKSNVPEVLEKELASWKSTMVEPVMVASATDAYQPAELKYGLTRRCVEVLQKYGVPYYVFTKSASAIEQDLELHSRYRERCFVVWSVTTCDERIRRVIEPGTPPAESIFDTIARFVRAGVPCGVNVDPIMPLITDAERDLVAVVDACSRAGVRHVFGAMLRMRHDIWERMKVVLQLLEIKSGVERYRQLYGFQEPLSANYVGCDKAYSEKILGMLEEMVAKSGMSAGFPDHMSPKRIERPSCKGQTTLLRYYYDA
jgi:DNA repair photolyase